MLVHMYRGKVRILTEVAVPFGQPSTCPARAVRALLAALAEAGRSTGPLFVRIDRHGRITAQAAAQIVERAGHENPLSGTGL